MVLTIDWLCHVSFDRLILQFLYLCAYKNNKKVNLESECAVYFCACSGRI